jgi:hypothetical protein
MLKPTFTALVLAAALAAPAAALDGPEQTVRRIYAMEDWHAAAQGPDSFLARDMATAFRRDLGQDEPSPAADMDWLYGGPGAEGVSGLEVENGVHVASPRGQTLMEVTVRFTEAGEPRAVIWRMCLARSGWRVADIRGAHPGGAAWSVRDYWSLPNKVKC